MKEILESLLVVAERKATEYTKKLSSSGDGKEISTLAIKMSAWGRLVNALKEVIKIED